MDYATGIVTLLLMLYGGKVYSDYIYVLKNIKDKEYDPLDFTDVSELGSYLARRKKQKALEEKRRLNAINKNQGENK